LSNSNAAKAAGHQPAVSKRQCDKNLVSVSGRPRRPANDPTGYLVDEIDSREAVIGSWWLRSRHLHLAASHSMSSSVDITMCVVPLRRPAWMAVVKPAGM
jgi:hypothetical protein